MWNGPGVGVAALLLVAGVAAGEASADPARVPSLSNAVLQAALRSAARPERMAAPVGSAPLPLVRSAGRSAGGSPGRRRRAPQPWMPASTLPLGDGSGPRIMDRASRSLDGVRRRVFTRAFGEGAARLGFYVGRNLARGDASGVRGGGLKYEF